MLREEQRNYEEDIVNKCKYERKLLYRHINEEIKRREGVERLKA